MTTTTASPLKGLSKDEINRLDKGCSSGVFNKGNAPFTAIEQSAELVEVTLFPGEPISRKISRRSSNEGSHGGNTSIDVSKTNDEQTVVYSALRSLLVKCPEKHPGEVRSLKVENVAIKRCFRGRPPIGDHSEGCAPVTGTQNIHRSKLHTKFAKETCKDDARKQSSERVPERFRGFSSSQAYVPPMARESNSHTGSSRVDGGRAYSAQKRKSENMTEVPLKKSRKDVPSRRRGQFLLKAQKTAYELSSMRHRCASLSRAGRAKEYANVKPTLRKESHEAPEETSANQNDPSSLRTNVERVFEGRLKTAIPIADTVTPERCNSYLSREKERRREASGETLQIPQHMFENAIYSALIKGAKSGDVETPRVLDSVHGTVSTISRSLEGILNPLTPAKNSARSRKLENPAYPQDGQATVALPNANVDKNVQRPDPAVSQRTNRLNRQGKITQLFRLTNKQNRVTAIESSPSKTSPLKRPSSCTQLVPTDSRQKSSNGLLSSDSSTPKVTQAPVVARIYRITTVDREGGISPYDAISESTPDGSQGSTELKDFFNSLDTGCYRLSPTQSLVTSSSMPSEAPNANGPILMIKNELNLLGASSTGLNQEGQATKATLNPNGINKFDSEAKLDDNEGYPVEGERTKLVPSPSNSIGDNEDPVSQEKKIRVFTKDSPLKERSSELVILHLPDDSDSESVLAEPYIKPLELERDLHNTLEGLAARRAYVAKVAHHLREAICILLDSGDRQYHLLAMCERKVRAIVIELQRLLPNSSDTRWLTRYVRRYSGVLYKTMDTIKSIDLRLMCNFNVDSTATPSSTPSVTTKSDIVVSQRVMSRCGNAYSRVSENTAFAPGSPQCENTETCQGDCTDVCVNGSTLNSRSYWYDVQEQYASSGRRNRQVHSTSCLSEDRCVGGRPSAVSEERPQPGPAFTPTDGSQQDSSQLAHVGSGCLESVITDRMNELECPVLNSDRAGSIHHGSSASDSPEAQQNWLTKSYKDVITVRSQISSSGLPVSSSCSQMNPSGSQVTPSGFQVNPMGHSPINIWNDHLGGLPGSSRSAQLDTCDLPLNMYSLTPNIAGSPGNLSRVALTMSGVPVISNRLDGSPGGMATGPCDSDLYTMDSDRLYGRPNGQQRMSLPPYNCSGSIWSPELSCDSGPSCAPVRADIAAIGASSTYCTSTLNASHCVSTSLANDALRRLPAQQPAASSAPSGVPTCIPCSRLAWPRCNANAPCNTSVSTRQTPISTLEASLAHDSVGFTPCPRQSPAGHPQQNVTNASTGAYDSDNNNSHDHRGVSPVPANNPLNATDQSRPSIARHGSVPSLESRCEDQSWLAMGQQLQGPDLSQAQQKRIENEHRKGVQQQIRRRVEIINSHLYQLQLRANAVTQTARRLCKLYESIVCPPAEDRYQALALEHIKLCAKSELHVNSMIKTFFELSKRISIADLDISYEDASRPLWSTSQRVLERRKEDLDALRSQQLQLKAAIDRRLTQFTEQAISRQHELPAQWKPTWPEPCQQSVEQVLQLTDN